MDGTRPRKVANLWAVLESIDPRNKYVRVRQQEALVLSENKQLYGVLSASDLKKIEDADVEFSKRVSISCVSPDERYGSWGWKGVEMRM